VPKENEDDKVDPKKSKGNGKGDDATWTEPKKKEEPEENTRR
jgi:hypothetical protein